ncbi:phospholipid scramblase 2-like isoform X2 [Panonychus citri]|uniref:phospholipid scramblase 2-like isoform X2 n=1 Tax=Panonychus citri TaxID=50023 RepID=UPI00230777F6|nr:phospholipid scramblase 2-like isoform X2 [Panonychus citri]
MSGPYSNQPPPIGLVGPPPNAPPPSYPGYPPAGQPGGYPPYPQPYGAPQPMQPPPMQPPYGQPGYPQPVHQQQPLEGNWMPAPMIPNCPPGLEYLTQINQLLVHQKVELLEAFIGFETKNKYHVKNSMGQKVYTASEQTDCCTRNCCGSSRPFDMKILDYQKREVLHFYRPLRCQSCWFPCCLQRLEVSASGSVCGYVEQSWSICFPKFRVCNAAGETVLRIEGPFCTFSICGDVEFHVLSRDGNTQVGRITKKWSGLARELFTDADHFGISFPMDLDVNIKAVLMGACFLIDFMFFENSI